VEQLPEAIFFPHKVIHIGMIHTVVVVVPTAPNDYQPAIHAILDGIFIKESITDCPPSPSRLPTLLFTQWGRIDDARYEIDNRASSTHGAAAPSCEAIMTSEVWWLLRGLPKSSGEHFF
jgi:hypothetical protein